MSDTNKLNSVNSRKITLLASSVVFMEWLEYALYMYLGVAISHYFFPEKSAGSDLPLILTYSIFAISYIGRPLGGLVFGVYADKKGRRTVSYTHLTLPTT